MTHDNLLAGPPPTLLPDDHAEAVAALGAGADPADVARRDPAACAPWAALAERALAAGDDVTAYAFARTGYHRGLDALRRNGWKGHGPVPWTHGPNQGFLRALHALGVAADRIGETAEAERCAAFLRDCDPVAEAALA